MAGIIKTTITLIKTTFNDSTESRKITNYALKFSLHLQFLEEITRVRRSQAVSHVIYIYLWIFFVKV